MKFRGSHYLLTIPVLLILGLGYGFLIGQGIFTPNAGLTLTKADSVACAGSAIQVKYTLTSTADSGNIFRVYLSDSSGNFSSSVQIGNRTDTLAGTINCTIPAGTPNGSNYRLRIIGNLPADTSNTTKIIIDNPKSQFSISPDSVCSGNNITFANTSSGFGLTYKWTFSDGQTSTSTSPTANFYSAGGGFATFQATLVATSKHGCKDTLTKSFVVKQRPHADLMVLDSVYCDTGVYSVFLLDINNSLSTSADSVYTLRWGDGSSDTTFSAPGYQALSSTARIIQHDYSNKGYFNLDLTVLGKNRCVSTRRVLIYNGGDPDIGGSSSGQTTKICFPDSLWFKIKDFTNNSPGTIYTVSSNDGSAAKTFSHPPPDSFNWVFKQLSCGFNSTNYNNSFFIKIEARNPCNSKTITIEPITFNSKPKANFSISEDTICKGDEVTVTDQSQLGRVVQIPAYKCDSASKRVWHLDKTNGVSMTSGDTGNYAQWNLPTKWGTSSVKFRFNDTGTYSVRLRVANRLEECGNDVQEKKVVVVIKPVAKFKVSPFDTAACAPFTDTFLNQSTGAGLIYQWTLTPNTGFTFTGGTSSSSEHPIIQFSNAGLYRVKLLVTNACGADSAFDTIKVKMKPQVTLPAMSNFCHSGTINPTASYNARQGTISGYSWSFPGGSPATSNSQNPGSISYSSPGTYTITARATNECGTDSVTRTFIIFPKPVVNAGSKDTLCANGGLKTLTGQSPSGGVWTGTGVSASGVFNPASAGVGNHTLTYTYTDTNGCKDSAIKIITVIPKPTAQFYAKSMCLDSVISFRDSSTGSVSTWSWNFGDGNTSTSQHPNHTYSASGNFNVRLIITSPNGCPDTITKTVTVYPKPTLNFNSNPKKQCLGGNAFSFTNTSSISGSTISWLWNFGDGTTDTSKTPTKTYFAAGKYRVTLTAISGFGCRNTDTIDIEVLPAPIPKIYINDTAQCMAGQSFIFRDSSHLNGASIARRLWNFGNGKTDTSANPASFAYTSPGRYRVSLLLVTADSCKDSAVVFVRADTMPSVDFTLSSGYCPKQAIIPTNISSSSPQVTSWNWSATPAGLSFSSNSAFQPAITLPDNQSGVDSVFSVRLVGMTASGCSDTAFQTLRVKSRPKALFDLGGDSCGPLSRVLINQSIGGQTWKWLAGGGVSISNDTSFQPTFSFPVNLSGSAVKHPVSLIARNAFGCLDTVSDTISIFPRPLARFSASANQGCTPFSVTFTNNSLPASGLNYIWDFGGGYSSTKKDTSFTFINNGTSDSIIPVKLSAFAGTGCAHDTILHIRVYPKPKAELAMTNSSGCAPFVIDSQVLKAKVYPQANATYTWYVNGSVAGTTPGFPGRTINNPNDSIKVKLVVQSPSGCGKDSVELWFRTISNPVPNFTFSPANGCSPRKFRLFNTSTPAGLGTEWVIGNSSWIIGSLDTVDVDLTNFSSMDTVWNIKLVVSAGSGCKDSISKNITVYPLPKPSFTHASSLCAPDSLSITNNTSATPSISQWQWQVWHGGTLTRTSTLQNPKFHFPDHQTGTDSVFTIRLISTTNRGCKDSIESTFTSRTRPIAGFSMADSSCGPVNFSPNDSSLYTSGYNWSSQPTVSISGGTTSNPIFSFPENTDTLDKIYMVKQVVNTVHGCKDSTVHPVVIHPRPQARFSLSVLDTCSPVTVKLRNQSIAGNGQGIGSMQHRWSFLGMQTSVQDTDIALVNTGTIDTVYQITLEETSVYGCWDDTTRQVVVRPNAKAAFTSAQTSGCAPFVLNSSVIQPIHYPNANTQYRWYRNGVALGGVQDSSTLSFPGYTLSNANDSVEIILVAISKYSCRPDTQRVWFRTIPNPVPDFDRSDTAGCTPFVVSFTNTSTPSSGLSYLWDFGNGQTSTQQHPSNIVFTNLGGTMDSIFTVKMMVIAGSGCKDSISKSIRVHPLPKPSFTHASSLCAPDSLSITNNTSATPNISQWQWQVWHGSTLTRTSTLQNPKFYFPDHQTGTDSVFTIRLISTTNRGCKDSIESTFTSRTRPIAGFSMADSSCGPVNFSPTDTSKYTSSYSWSAQPTVSISGGTTSNPTFSFPENTDTLDKIYILKQVVFTVHGCKDSVVHPVVIHPRPRARFSLSVQDTCSPVTVKLRNQSIAGNGQGIGSMQHRWSFLGMQTNVQDTELVLVNTGTIDTVYQITLEETTLYGCWDDTIRHVVVRPNAKAAFIAAQTSGCAPFVLNSSVIQPIHYPNANAQYRWYRNGVALGGVQDSSTLSFPGYTIANANDSVEIMQVAIPKYSCRQDTQRVWFRTIPNPVPDFDRSDTAGCTPFVVSFTNTSTPSSGLNYIWDFGNGQTSTQQHPSNIVFTNLGGTVDSVFKVKLVVIAGTGCKDSIIKNITVHPLPRPNLSFQADTVCYPGMATGVNQTAFPPSVKSYIWSTLGDTSIHILNDTGSASTGITFPDNQSGNYHIYPIRIYAYTNFGCIDSFTRSFYVASRPIAAFTVNPDSSCGPNVFSVTNQSQYGGTWIWSSPHPNLSFSNSSAFEPTIFIPENNGLSDSVYTIRLLAINKHGCRDSAFRQVIIHPRPRASFTQDSINSCGPVTVKFTNTSWANTKFASHWDFGDGGTSNDSHPTHIFYPSGYQDSIYTIRLIITSDYGCKDTVLGTMTVRPSPTARLRISDTLLCTRAGFPAIQQIQSFTIGKADEFVWYFGDGDSVRTTMDTAISHSYTVEGRYTLKLKAINECNTSWDSITFTVLEPPRPKFTKVDTVSCDRYYYFTNITDNPLTNRNIQFRWIYSTGDTFDVFQPDTFDFGLNRRGADTVLKVTLLAWNQCDTVVFVDSVRQRTKPVAHLVPAKQTGCSPLKMPFFNYSLGVDSLRDTLTNYYVFHWGDSANTIDTVRNRKPIYHTYFTGETDTFTIILYAINECDIDSDKVDIIVYPNTVIPYVTIQPANGRGCVPLTVNFTNRSVGATKYIWKPDSVNTSTQKDLTWTFTKAGYYRVELIASNGCSDTSAYTDIYVSDPPKASFYDSGNTCTPAQISFINTTTGGDSWLWRSSQGDSSTLKNPTFTFTQAGTYWVSLKATHTDSFGVTCSDSISRNIIIRDRSVPILEASDTSGCEPLQISFSGQKSSFTSSWFWTFGDGGSSSLQKPSHTFTTLGRDTQYTVWLFTNNVYGCKDSIAQQIYVKHKPTAAFTVDDSDVCYPEATWLRNASSYGAVRVLWDFGDGQTDTSFYQVQHAWTRPGYYHVKLTVYTINGCTDTVSGWIRVGGNDTLQILASDTILCQDVYGTFRAPSLQPQTVKWNWGDGNTDTGRVVIHRWNAPGTYQVIMTFTGADACIDSVQRNVYIRPLPTPDFVVVDSQKCINNQPFVFVNLSSSAFGFKKFTWKWGDGNVSVASDTTRRNHTYSNPGTYTVWLIVESQAGCIDSISRNVHVFPKPIPAFSINNADQCLAGNRFVLTNQSSIAWGYNDYNWDFGDGNTSTSTHPSHTYQDTGSYRIKLFISSDLGCIDTVEKWVRVRPNPKAHFGIASDTSQCLDGNRFVFLDSSTIHYGGMRYRWDFGNGDSSTLKNPVYTYKNQGIYQVRLIVFSDFQCPDTFYRTVYVRPEPAAGIQINDTMQCVNQQQFIYTSTTQIAGGSLIQYWDYGDGTLDTGVNPAAHQYANPGIYTVSLKVYSEFGCVDSTQRLVYVMPKPNPGFYAEDTGICLNGGPMRFHNTSSISAGTLTYIWRFGDGNISTQFAPTHQYSSEGFYTVTLLAISQAGCLDSIQLPVRIFPKPMVSISIPDSEQCFLGNQVTFRNRGRLAFGNQIYRWDFGDGQMQDINSQADVYHQYAIAGTYTIILHAFTDSGCHDSAISQVIIRPMPEADFDVDTSLCILSPIAIFRNTSRLSYGGMSYWWNFGDGDTSVLEHPVHRYRTTGSFTITLYVTSTYGCRDTIQKTIYISPSPDAVIQLSDSVGCNQLWVDYSAAGSRDAVEYYWDFDDPISGNNTATGVSASHLYSQAGYFNPRLIVKNIYGCYDTVYSQVQVYPDPLARFVPLPGQGCDTPAFVNFTNLSSGAVAYAWNFGDGKTSSVFEPTHLYQRTGTFNITLTVISTDGCRDSLTIPFVVAPEPKGGFRAGVKEGCQPLAVQFTDLSTSALRYYWDFGDGFTDTVASPIHIYRFPGEFVVQQVVRNGNCYDTLIKDTIRVYQKPVADFSYDELGDTAQGLVSFTNASLYATHYQWDFGDGSKDTVVNPVHDYLYDNDSFIVVRLIALNNDGCSDTMIKPMPLRKIEGLFVPNAMSPGQGPGLYSVFKPIGIGIKEYRVTIHNFWGELIWESDSLDELGRPAEAWDGTYRNGVPCKEDVYIWTVYARYRSGREYKRPFNGKMINSGTVTLIR